jgi:hypothetical protein
LKICDFGLAQELGEGELRLRLVIFTVLEIRIQMDYFAGSVSRKF